jgi:SAGA-associated factor 29
MSDLTFDMMTEKRNKHLRAASPSRSSTPGTPPVGGNVTLPERDGTFRRIPFTRDPNARRKWLGLQLPLQEGRKIAFFPPYGVASGNTRADVDDTTWILAVVVECLNQDKNRLVSRLSAKSMVHLLILSCTVT